MSAKPASDRLDPLPQKWFDENRERFDASTTETVLKVAKCDHFFYRKDSQTVECKHCRAGWIDNGAWNVVDGKIT